MSDFTLNLRKKIASHKYIFRSLVLGGVVLVSSFFIWGSYKYAMSPLYQTYKEQENLIYIHDADMLTPARIALYSETINNKNEDIKEAYNVLKTIVPTKKTVHNVTSEISKIIKDSNSSLGAIKKTGESLVSIGADTLAVTTYDFSCFGVESDLHAMLQNLNNSKSLFSVQSITFSDLTSSEQSKYADTFSKVILGINIYNLAE